MSHPDVPRSLEDHTLACPALASTLRAHPLPPANPSGLLAELDAHLQELNDALAQNEFLDIALAHRLDHACRALLALWPTLDATARTLVSAGVRYFINPDDEDHDFDSLIGFEDDELVLRYVCGALGVPDLLP